MDWILRPECPADYREVEHITREAFWSLHGPKTIEHLLAHKLRRSTAFVPQLDFVALSSGARIVGNIMYSVARVVNNQGKETEVLILGPLSVLPAYQGHGIGSALVQHTLKAAKALPFPCVLIFGHPNYYCRHGFKNAQTFGITTQSGENMDAFMALELHPGALAGVQGRLLLDKVFSPGEDEVASFEKQFPHKAEPIWKRAQ